MPPRLSKRQQREQEELEALAGPSRVEETSDQSDESPTSLKSTTITKGAVGFAALIGDEYDEDEQAKKKKKKGPVTPTSGSPQATAGSAKKRPKSEQDASKSKSKSKPKVDEEEDIDKILAELSGKYSNVSIGNPHTHKPTSLSAYDVFHDLLSVSVKNLDPETELRRFFGSKVITSPPPGAGSRSSRSNLARPQPAWPPAHYRAGLSMRPLTSDEILLKGSGVSPDTKERWWKFEASPRYKATTYEYLQYVMGGDPQLFYNLMHEMPWHADTLLQMAEVYRHREDYSTAADFMSRALFAYERAFTGAFNFTSGVHRLDFDHVENRVFSLALARTIVDLNRRGTPQTAFEFARLSYSLDPHTDPHGALLHLDSLAIKAKKTDWLLGLWDAFENTAIGRDGAARFDVTLLPGWHWSRALALFEREGESDKDHAQSTEALKDAIAVFPSIAPLLADKLDIVMPSELRNLNAFRVMTGYSPHEDDLPTSLVHLLSHIYVIRSASLWKSPPRFRWLSKCLTSLSSSDVLNSTPPPALARFRTLFHTQSNLSDAIYRHVITTAPLTLEFRRLTAFFPGDIKHRAEENIEGDPLPPSTVKTIYCNGYFLNVNHRSGLSGVPRQIGDPEALRELQALWEGIPALAARFPGGVPEIGAMARQFPQELLNVMVDILGRDPNAAPPQEPENMEGRMPGGEQVLAVDNAAEQVHERMPDEALVIGQDAVIEQEEREQEERERGQEQEQEEQQFLPLRIFRSLLDRLWGGPGNDGDESDSDELEEAGGSGPDDVD
ncbi:DUF654-domain-containing protein [Hysterangium stoloniferum]|nr:DUF654-domain-containing protein [Hysterangium stoloniferum]